jgi:hypothetical protein
MNKNLVMDAFAKAEKEIKKTGVKNPSLTQIATELSDYLEEKAGIVLGERSLRVYRGEALKLLNEEDDISIKQLMVINGLCKYLGYDTYQDFIKNTTSKNAETKLLSNKKRVKFSQAFKVTTMAVVIGILSFLMYNYTHRQRWMVWQQDHYIEVEFDAKKYGVNQLKLYKEDRISSFKKVDVNCNTVFFSDDGSPRFWYGKNRKKQLELFTDLGLHPETGKTLKPITGYMIEKYVCVEKNKFID